MGGSAAEIEGLNAAVGFTGTAARAGDARIKTPVAAFFGANDLGLAPRIAPATADISAWGKPSRCRSTKRRRTCFSNRQDLGRKCRQPRTRGRKRWRSSSAI